MDVDASRRAALLVTCIRPVCALLAPCRAGASTPTSAKLVLSWALTATRLVALPYPLERLRVCFLPGIPQVYYVGLLAGRNDMTLLARTGVGRDINRHYFTADEVQPQLGRPIVERTLALLKLRNTHPAFAGVFDASSSTRDRLVLTWSLERDWITLDVDLTQMHAAVASSAGRDPVWQSSLGKI